MPPVDGDSASSSSGEDETGSETEVCIKTEHETSIDGTPYASLSKEKKAFICCANESRRASRHARPRYNQQQPQKLASTYVYIVVLRNVMVQHFLLT